VPEAVTSFVVRVTGARADSAALTWGQRSIWGWHGNPSGEVRFNNGDCFGLPAGCTLAAIAAAIELTLRRHDGLRTVLRPDAGGWRQEVEGAGEITVAVYETVEEGCWPYAVGVGTELSALPWDGGEWPVRLAAILVDGAPTFLAVAYNRLVLDAQSVVAVRDELSRTLATGEPGPAPAWGPLDEARFEQSPDGAAVNDRALDYWRRTLLRAPASMFDFPVRQCDGDRFAMGGYESPAMARATQMLRARWRLTGSALTVAALVTMLSRYTGHDSVAMQILAGNRGTRERRDMVGSLGSEGVLCLDVAGRTFAQLARDTFRASGAAHQFAFCDPAGTQAVVAEVELRRGAHVDLGICFDDVQTGLDDLTEEPEMSERELLDRVRAGTALHPGDDGYPPGWRLAWTSPTSPTRKKLRMLLIAQHGRNRPLSLFCDTRYFSRDTMVGILAGMERLLLAAACDGVGEEPDRLAPVARGGSWVRCGDGWLDLAESARVWREVAGTPRSALVVEPGGDGPDGQRLVGYLAGDGAPPFARLHRSFLAAIGEREDVRAPAWYRWVEAPRADDAAAWRDATPRAESDGRDPAAAPPLVLTSPHDGRRC
jgi:hypothetical protein